MKRGLEAYSSEQVAAIRMFVAFICMFPFWIKLFDKNDLKYWPAFLTVGLFGNFIPAFLFTKAETGISSALAGMLNGLTPLFTLILGVLVFKTKVKWFQVTGIIIAFLGAIGLITAGNSISTENTQLFYSLLVALATLCYGISVNTIKAKLNHVAAIKATAWAFTLVGPMAGIYLFSTDFIYVANTHPQGLSSLGYVFILGAVGTALSVALFNVLIRQTTAIFASSVTYLIPIVAIIWGIVDGETIFPMQLLFISLIITGIYLVNKKG